jgi:hypothetical protein
MRARDQIFRTPPPTLEILGAGIPTAGRNVCPAQNGTFKLVDFDHRAR